MINLETWFNSDSIVTCVDVSELSLIAGLSAGENDKWTQCIESIERLGNDLSSTSNPPNFEARHLAIKFLKEARRQGYSPPLMIDQEPAGGFIVTFEEEKTLREWTFYNSGEVEFTKYIDNKVVLLQSVSRAYYGFQNASKYASNWTEQASSAMYQARTIESQRPTRARRERDLVDSW